MRSPARFSIRAQLVEGLDHLLLDLLVGCRHEPEAEHSRSQTMIEQLTLGCLDDDIWIHLEVVFVRQCSPERDSSERAFD